MKKIMLALAMFVAVSVQAAPPDVFQPRTDRYDVSWGAIGLGEGTISLSALPGGNCYRFETVTKPLAIVRWTYGSPRETSEFCVEDGQIRPRHFEYHNDKRAKDGFTLDFDHQAAKVKAIKNGEIKIRELPEQAYDRFLIQLVVRQWVIANAGQPDTPPLEVKMVDHRRIKTYRFEIAGAEKLDTPAGRFDTLLVQRIDDPDNSLRFWVAPSLGYVPVKVQQIEKGETKLQMLLQKS